MSQMTKRKKMKPVKAWALVDKATGECEVPTSPRRSLLRMSLKLRRLIDDKEYRIARVEIREVSR